MMNMKSKLVVFWGVLSLLLTACNEDNSSGSSSVDPVAEQDPTPAVEVVEETESEQLKAITLNVTPGENHIDLNWTSVASAADYQVYRYRADVDAEPYVENSAGETQFSFSTADKESYQVWVVALNDAGNALVESKKVLVTSAMPGLKLADETAP